MPNNNGKLRTMGRPVGSINQTPVAGKIVGSGAINHNPNPGVGDMADKGVIDIKFAETGINPQMNNPVRQIEGVKPLSEVINNPSSKVDRSKNQTRSMGMNPRSGK